MADGRGGPDLDTFSPHRKHDHADRLQEDTMNRWTRSARSGLGVGAACLTLVLTATVLVVGSAWSASAATCSPSGHVVALSASASGVPQLHLAASTRRVALRTHLSQTRTRHLSAGVWTSSASATSAVTVAASVRVTTSVTRVVTASTHVVCGGVTRTVSATGKATRTATATALARVTARGSVSARTTGVTNASSRVNAAKLATTRAVAKATASATTSARSRAQTTAGATSLASARARATAAAAAAARTALRVKLAGNVTRTAASRFPSNGTFDYQIGGPYTPSSSVTILDRDHTATPVAGKYNVCYVNAFQSQPGESGSWGPLLLRTPSGGLVQDPNWPGEYVVDTRQSAAVAAFVGPWVKECAAKGFQAVELDNLDSDTRSGGLLTSANNLDVFRRLAKIGHAAGVLVGQKNTVELSAQAKAAGADFAIAEECQVYSECSGYSAVYGTAWVEIEYQSSAFTTACSARGGTTSVILRDVDVVPAGDSGYVYRSC